MTREEAKKTWEEGFIAGLRAAQRMTEKAADEAFQFGILDDDAWLKFLESLNDS